MFVIGTAGHVDHGKSALVHALTGIDPDRLQEEKERGMTIDLGFAWLRLPGGREVSIVDVPGHERFVHNMLAGIGGVDLALLVIAADEGVMPQTREHLAIIDLLEIKHGVLVVTKKDLVDEEWLGLVDADAHEAVKETVLAGAPLVNVSSVTREGLDDLVAIIHGIVAGLPPRADLGRPRLPVDRVFTVPGFGTIVTGTLVDGVLNVGQEAEVLPQRLRTRIRGLQTHRQKLETAQPGSRVAANLAGLSTDHVSRGDVVTVPGWLSPTTALDARVRAVPDLPRPLRHNARVTFHLGSGETPARLRLLDRDQLGAGEEGLAQMRLDRPVASVRGDAFIFRTSQGTAGGGRVLDPFPRRHRRFAANVIQALEAREHGDPARALLETLAPRQPAEAQALLERTTLAPAEGRAALESLVAQAEVVPLGGLDTNPYLFTRDGWRRLALEASEALSGYHRSLPLNAGMPKEELKSRLKLPGRAFPAALERLVKEGELAEDGSLVRLPSHQPRLTASQQAEADAFLQALEREPYAPAPEKLPDPAVLAFLTRQGRIVRLGDNVCLSAPRYEEMERKVLQQIKQRGKITVAEVRDLFQTSRKYALALMEHLAEKKLTRRVGDEHVLR